MTNANLLSWDKNHLLPITLQECDKTVTFLNVLVQLVDKRVQLLPLLGRKLKCITGMNPLTQGTAIEQRNRSTKRENYPSLLEAEVKDNKRGECLPRADALSVGSHESEQGEETLRNEPLQYNHIFIYWSMPEDYSFHVTPFTRVSYSIHLSWEEFTIWTITS